MAAVFTDEELKEPMFFEVTKHPTDGPKRGLITFSGFYTEEQLVNARVTRQSWNMVTGWYSRGQGRPIPMSQYLYFIAGLFAEIEAQNEPARENPNPCAEVPLRGVMDTTNLKDTTCPATGRPCTKGCYEITGLSCQNPHHPFA